MSLEPATNLFLDYLGPIQHARRSLRVSRGQVTDVVLANVGGRAALRAGHARQQRQPARQLFLPLSSIGKQEHTVGDVTLPDYPKQRPSIVSTGSPGDDDLPVLRQAEVQR